MSGFDRFSPDPDPSARKQEGKVLEEQRTGVRTLTDTTISGPLRHTGATAGFFGAAAVSRPTALTAANATAVGAVWTATEQGVVNNMRTRLNELETKLRDLGLLT